MLQSRMEQKCPGRFNNNTQKLNNYGYNLSILSRLGLDQKCYLGGTPEACLPCPSLSSSQGGMVRVCPCLEGTRRVNDSD